MQYRVWLFVIIALCMTLCTLRANEEEKLKARFDLNNASRQGAVKEAIDYLLTQEGANNASLTNFSYDTTDNRQKCINDKNCPVCKVTFNKIKDEGVFVYDQKNEPIYDDKCFSMKLRYHTAPECIKREDEEGIKQITKFRWTLQSALDAKCRMPDVSSPSIVLSSFMNSINESLIDSGGKAKKKTILMLGLSFIAQPYQSLGCLYYDTLVDSFTWLNSGDKRVKRSQKNTTFTYNLHDMVNNGGKCTGFHTENISDYYPKHLHPNVDLPKQSVPFCSLDHSMMQFQGKSTKNVDRIYSKIENSDIVNNKLLPQVIFCYQYTFNVVKNVPRGHPLPCGLKWDEIDIVLSIEDSNTIFNTYMPHTGGDVNKLSKLKIIFINKIYSHEAMLVKAYKNYNFTLPLKGLLSSSFRAKYKECGAKSDIHYRMPGIPDSAAITWLSMIATGMTEGYKTRGAVQYWE